MIRLTYLLGITFAASVTPNSAVAQSVSLDPGFYDYSHVIDSSGLQIAAEDAQYCVREGENSRSIDELIEGLSGAGDCELNNVSLTNSTGRADINCTDTDLGLDIQGTVEAEFGSNFFDVGVVASLGPIPIGINANARRRGECPVDWKNPDE